MTSRLAYTPQDAARSLVTVPVTFRTRYGSEVHNHVDGAVHIAGPTCPCGPQIRWKNEEGK